MSLYTRARKHIDMDRVKELREEKIKREQIAKLVQEQERIRAELEYIEAEESKYINWRSELEEGMNTSGMGMVNYPGEGDVDLATAVSSFTLSGPSGHGWNSVNKYLGSDRSKYDTIVVTVNSNSSEWEIIPTTSFNVLGSGGSGTYTITIPRIYPGLYYTARDDGSISFSTKYQRRAPLNVVVPLDDPDSSAFVRDGDFDRLSNEQKKKKLEEQLSSSEEYLNKMFGQGMPKGATTIADYEPQQSFMDIKVAQGLPYTDEDDAFDDPYYKGPPPDLDDDSDFDPDSFEYAGLRPDGTQGFNQPGDEVYDPATKKKYKLVPKKGYGYNQWVPIEKAGGGDTMVAHYEPQGKVLSEKKRLKSPKSLIDKIPGYYDGKPSPLGFPVEEPPKMKNGFHPDLVDGKKVANRFNRLDPQSAKAMPKTGNPHIDKKVRAAAKKLK